MKPTNERRFGNHADFEKVFLSESFILARILRGDSGQFVNVCMAGSDFSTEGNEGNEHCFLIVTFVSFRESCGSLLMELILKSLRLIRTLL